MDDYSKCAFKEYTELVTETDKAWLLNLIDETENRWFPKSICELDQKTQWLIMPIWLFEKIWGKEDLKIRHVPLCLDAGPKVEEDLFL